MSILVDSAKEAQYRDGYIVVYMESGVEIRFPVKGNRRLAQGTAQQLNNIQLSPYGLHWPDLDEDLSFSGLLRGDYGQYIGTGTGPCARSAFDDAPSQPYGSSSDAAL